MIRDVNTETRPLRADAERNRKRLLDAAAAVFAEHGLEASTAEIARRAGVGQGTVFRRFPTKDDLVAAIVVDRLARSPSGRARWRRIRRRTGAVLAFMAELASMHVRDRGLIEAVNGTRALADPAVHDAHGELLDVLEDVVKRDREAGLVREDLGAFDVMALEQGRRVGMRARHRARRLEALPRRRRGGAAPERREAAGPRADARSARPSAGRAERGLSSSRWLGPGKHKARSMSGPGVCLARHECASAVGAARAVIRGGHVPQPEAAATEESDHEDPPFCPAIGSSCRDLSIPAGLRVALVS